MNTFTGNIGYDPGNPIEPSPKPLAEAMVEDAASTPQEKAMVAKWTERLSKARTFWEPVFKRMRENMDFAAGVQGGYGDVYRVNFTQRLLQFEVANIYAKNPTVTTRRRDRMEYQVWDGTDKMLADARGGKLPPVEAMAVISDVEAGRQRKRMLDRLSKTLELVYQFQLDAQEPDFEQQMKDAILRERTTGVAFVAVKFAAAAESVPGVFGDQFADQLQTVNAAQADAVRSGNPEDAETAEADAAAAALESSLEGGDVFTRERLVLDFKTSTSILVDPACRSLHGFQGAAWIAEMILMTPSEIEAQFGKDIRSHGGVQCYEPESETAKNTSHNDEWPEDGKVMVFVVYDRRHRTRMVIADGYDEFLEPPEFLRPSVSGFWPVLALKLNRLEVEKNDPENGVTIYGNSLVDLIRPMQEEMNRTQEALKEHRTANRPGLVCPKDALTENDRKALSNRSAHDVIPLESVPPDQFDKAAHILAPIPANPLDVNLYRTDGIMHHVMLVSGGQQSNMGQQAAGEKATGQAIAEQSRVTAVSSDVDCLNRFMSELARICGEMLLSSMSEATVKELAGPGAVWPQSNEARSEIKQMLYLQIEAGSSGRPNKALEMQNLQIMLPRLIELAQARGLPLDPLIKWAATVTEFDFDVEEWLSSDLQQMPGAIPGSIPVTQGGMATNPMMPSQQAAPQVGEMMARIRQNQSLPTMP